MTTTEKCSKIGDLLEEKNITIRDDYFFDIFEDEEGKEIFSTPTQRFAETEKEEHKIMDTILEKLSSYAK